MDQKTYDEHVAKIKGGKLVVIEGRSALSTDQLDFAIRASGDTVPGDPEPENTEDAPEDLNGDGKIDALEGMKFADLQILGAQLGLTIKSGVTTKIDAIAQIRAAQAAQQS